MTLEREAFRKELLKELEQEVYRAENRLEVVERMQDHIDILEDLLFRSYAELEKVRQWMVSGMRKPIDIHGTPGFSEFPDTTKERYEKFNISASLKYLSEIGQE
jgi:hypothetical protein